MRVLACLTALGDSSTSECRAAVDALRPAREAMDASQIQRFAELVRMEEDALTTQRFRSRSVADFVALRGSVAIAACVALFAVLVAAIFSIMQRLKRGKGHTVFVSKD
jgi:hypothetical protein